MSAPLVLSLFPGADLFGFAFEREGFCVVQGPDIQFGRDVRAFHVPQERFDGIIGGPPCRLFTGLANFAARWKHPPEDLIPEYERIVAQGAPAWFVMENVRNAPEPRVAGYVVRSILVNNRLFGGAQNRERRFSFGTRDGRALDIGPFVGAIAGRWQRAVTNAHAGKRQRMKGDVERYPLEEAMALQGLPADYFEHSPLTKAGMMRLVANGVPLPMGRAIARAVRAAMYGELEQVA